MISSWPDATTRFGDHGGGRGALWVDVGGCIHCLVPDPKLDERPSARPTYLWKFREAFELVTKYLGRYLCKVVIISPK